MRQLRPTFDHLQTWASIYYGSVQVPNRKIEKSFLSPMQEILSPTQDLTICYVGLIITYIGLSISYIGLSISYVGIGISYIGLIISYVGLSITYIGLSYLLCRTYYLLCRTYLQAPFYESNLTFLAPFRTELAYLGMLQAVQTISRINSMLK